MSLQDKLFAEFHQGALMRKAHAMGQEYLSDVMTRDVAPSAQALAALTEFEEPMPERGSDPHAVLATLNRLAAPATIAQLGGKYFGFVNGAALPVSHASRLLADHWDQNAALGVISPAAAKVEEVTEEWLAQLFDLPKDTATGFVTGSSLAILAGLAAGRWRLFERLGWDFNARGYHGAPKLRVITGQHAHGTVLKMISLLGFGLDQVETIPVDDQGCVLADALPTLDDHSLLILQAGNVTSGAFDDFEHILPRAQEAGAWTHIDGAFGLWAETSARLRHLTRGANLADSFSADGHKTLNTPYDCGFAICRDRKALQSALHSTGGYIQHSNRDGMFLTPDMSRRARGFEVWAALKYLGRTGVEELVNQLHHNAAYAAKQLSQAGFTILNDVVFNQVVIDPGMQNPTPLMQHIQESGTCWVGPGKWFDQDIIRFSVCSWATTQDDIDQAVAAFTAARHATEANI